MHVKKAVIPAAGMGTRFLPITKAQPKEMLPLVDKPAIQYIVEEAVNSGIEDIIIVTGRGKRAIEDHFDRSLELEIVLKKRGRQDLLKMIRNISSMVEIHYVRQAQPKGLGDAVYSARKFIGNEPFAVLLADDIIISPKPCLKQLIDFYYFNGGTVLGIKEVPYIQVQRYGIIEPEKKEGRVLKVKNLVEKPSPGNSPSNLGIIGRYIIEPQIFDILRYTPPGENGEIQLTDALQVMAKERNVYGYLFEGKRYDIGNPQEFLRATVEIALQKEELKKDFQEYLQQLVVNRWMT